MRRIWVAFVLFLTAAALLCLFRGDGAGTRTLGPSPERAPADRNANHNANHAQERAAPRTQPDREPRAEAWSAGLRGTAVNTMRRPVCGAQVVAAIEGVRCARIRTDASGRFAISFHDPRRGGARVDLWIQEQSTGAAHRLVCRVPDAGTDDLGRILLTPARRVRVIVRAAGEPQSGADVYLGMRGETWRALVAHVRTDSAGRAVVEGLPRNLLVAVACKEGWGEGTAEIESGALEAVVDLPPERRVRVHVRDQSGAPVQGARITVAEVLKRTARGLREAEPLLPAIPETGASGYTWLRGLGPATQVEIRTARAPGCLPRGRDEEWILIGPRETEAQVILQRRSTVRWPIDPTAPNCVVPPAERVRLVACDALDRDSRWKSVGEGRIEGGWLSGSLHLPAGHFALAVTASGLVARVRNPESGGAGAPVAFFPGRSIHVRLRNEDGTPAAGLGVAVRLVGGMRLSPVARTDERGEVTLGDLYPFPGGQGRASAWVECLPFTPSEDGVRSVARVGLGKVEQAVEATIPAERRIVVAMVLDGTPRLPPDYAVRGPGLSTRPLSEDPERGEVVFRARPLAPGRDLEVSVFAGGYRAAQGVKVVHGTAVVELESTAR